MPQVEKVNFFAKDYFTDGKNYCHYTTDDRIICVNEKEMQPMMEQKIELHVKK